MGMSTSDCIELEVQLKLVCFNKSGRIKYMQDLLDKIKKHGVNIRVDRFQASGYDYQTRTITLSDISDDDILETFFYAFQDAVLPDEAKVVSREANIIFEAKMFVAIYKGILSNVDFITDVSFIVPEASGALSDWEKRQIEIEVDKLQQWFNRGWSNYGYSISPLFNEYEEAFAIFQRHHPRYNGSGSYNPLNFYTLLMFFNY